jgi:hypothetical protein
VDSNINDVAFVQATTMIGGRDIIKEFLACRMYPLLVGFGFKNVTDGTTAMSKVVVPLPVFPVEPILMENVHHFLAKVETEPERILGSYGPKEHDACIAVKLPNGGRLSRVFEQMGAAYTTHQCQVPMPSLRLRVNRKPMPWGRRKKGEDGPDEERGHDKDSLAEAKTWGERYV